MGLVGGVEAQLGGEEKSPPSPALLLEGVRLRGGLESVAEDPTAESYPAGMEELTWERDSVPVIGCDAIELSLPLMDLEII